ncbi:hypothetical protein WBP06_07725 [Novosphingobium sp. BL-8H]|uniref:hypothetical protein n=1 Tax=Novosphingobium sp. BL-8H TaxID=3127640 RepID=UPI003757E8B5
MIRASLLLIGLFLSGCQRTSEQDRQLAALPAEVMVPQCTTMRVRWASYWTGEDRGERFYRDVVQVSATPDCIEKWQKSLDGKDWCEYDEHGCPMYVRSNDREFLIAGARGDTVTISWRHPSATPGMHYVDNAEF